MEFIRPAVIILGSVLTFVAAIPYMIETVRGNTKPRIVSWATWAFILGAGGVAALLDGQVPAGALMLTTAVEAVLIVALGLKKGTTGLEQLDTVCLAAISVGIVLWLFFRSPNLIIATIVLIDLIGTVPTFLHAWFQPYEETLSTYVLFSAGDALILAVSSLHIFTAVAYPAYVLLSDAAIMLLLLASPYRKFGAASAPAPAQKPQLNMESGLITHEVGATDELTKKLHIHLPSALQRVYSAHTLTAAIASRVKALPIPLLDDPSWSVSPITVGQSSILTVAVTIPEHVSASGMVYGEYSVGSLDASRIVWYDNMSWEGDILTVMLGPFPIPGIYQINVRAKYELGNWGHIVCAFLAVHPTADSQS